MTDHSEQLAWEARWAKPAAAAAFASALFSIVSFVVRAAAIGDERPEDDREVLLEFADKQGEFLISLAAQSISLVLLAGALLYLLKATAARRTEVPGFAAIILLVAPLLLVTGGLFNHFAVADIADQFRDLAPGERTDDRAENLLDDRSILGSALGSGGSLCLAIAFVLTTMNAMRSGLLTRFMGILGVIVGALVVLPIVPGAQGVLQVFWLVALGILFIGRWPGGRGPAWDTAESVPWPPATSRRFEQAEAPAEGSIEAGGGPSAPAKRKRKRKR